MSKMNRILKVICTVMAVLIISVVAVACNKPDNKPKEYTLSFVAEGLEIPSIKAVEGSEITPPADPSKDGFTFEGWYTNPNFTGDAVTLPTVMPKGDITYYARFAPVVEPGSVKVIYDVNTILAKDSITPSYGEPGDVIKVKDGSAYEADGLLFIGWSLQQNGLVSQFGNPENGQYLAGDSLTLGEQDVTLYAQWAYEQEPVGNKGNGKLYLYFNYIGRGNGAVILVRDGKPNKLGFVSNRVNQTDDYYEFTFMFEDDDDYGSDTVLGRLYDDSTYAFKDNLQGSYLYYDYIYGVYLHPDRDVPEILTVDGYGRATITQLIKDQTKVLYFGSYVYDEEYGDYVFTELNVETKKPVLTNQGKVHEFNISINLGVVEGIGENQFKGTYTEHGNESGSYLLYDNGDLLNYRLDLYGYGYAKLLAYDPVNETIETIEGVYYASEKYEDAAGEWIFVSEDASKSFRFILSMIQSQSDIIYIYIEYDAFMNRTLTGEDGSTLYLDGYGSALYEAGGISYLGNFTANSDGNLLTFISYIKDDKGNVSAAKMYFTVDWDNNTYVMDETGYIKNNGTLISYVGESPIIVIPKDVTAIADDAFNYMRDDAKVSIVSVVIHDGVTNIGARAFENYYSLMRVVFESETPVTIDWKTANDEGQIVPWNAADDPFRWPSGNFIIVVPEGSQEAYKTAWADSPYVNNIKGSDEVTRLPEYEIVDGVLIRYNIQPDAPDMLDLVIPDDVTEIADRVFRGFTNLRSVDLNNVVKIGDGAFEVCKKLERVTFTNVTTIGEGAFNGCELLGSATNGVIELPAIKTIGESAFASCYELLRVTIGENILSIGSFAFAETNMEIAHGPIFIELTGNTSPEMGEKVFNGNIATRIKVNDINVVLACYNNPTFLTYNKHLYIESGAEAGTYFDGADPLVLDGRAVLLSSYVMMYHIDGENITFYEFDEENATYYPLSGTYKDGVISFVMGGVRYNFKLYDGTATFISEDGKYTLVCDPMDLLPESYADTNYTGTATVTFNGKQVLMRISGYNSKIIKMFFDEEDGKYYDFAIIIVGDTLIYEKATAETRFTVTAEDGSELTIHVTANSVYIYGTLKIVVAVEDGQNVMLPNFGDYSAAATNVSGNTYTFERLYKSEKKFIITVTVSEDQTTFTYTYQTINLQEQA